MAFSKRSLAYAGFLALVVSFTRPLRGQDVRGTVTDLASGQPIAGAVLTLLDSAGASLGRNFTNERGEYRIAAVPTMRRIRVLRIGFRAQDAVLPPANAGVTLLDFRMSPIPTMLESVRVTGSATCPARSDRGEAFALLEQARAGLLTTVVAREANPASMVFLYFVRTMSGTTNRAVRQTVRVDTSRQAKTTSFQAARPAADFLKSGFLENAGLRQTFFGPDAETLLDDAFIAGYCFHIQTPDAARPTQVGLAFLPATTKKGRVDINGTLWIDTAARALREIEFRYLGLDRNQMAALPGGLVSFKEMANGVVLVDRWFLRLPSGPMGEFLAQENGGELASATWRDGHSYDASLGHARIRLIDLAGKALMNVEVRLVGTGYVTTSDSSGTADFSGLLPGPYFVSAKSAVLGKEGGFQAMEPFIVDRALTIKVEIIVPVTVVPDSSAQRGRGGRPGGAAPFRLSSR